MELNKNRAHDTISCKIDAYPCPEKCRTVMGNNCTIIENVTQYTNDNIPIHSMQCWPIVGFIEIKKLHQTPSLFRSELPKMSVSSSFMPFPLSYSFVSRKLDKKQYKGF